MKYNTGIMTYFLSKKSGFTLAEVLITLGIIGVVAAITIPTLASNIQQAVFKNQFKKTFSLLKQAIIGIQTEEGRPLKCFYWQIGKYPCTETCREEDKNEYGNCTKYICAETGEPLPPNYNGYFDDCPYLDNKLFFEKLKVVKYCENNALSNGCITDDYRGLDKVQKEQNPDKDYNPYMTFSDLNLKNVYPAFILSDGTTIIKYAHLGSMPVYAFDINGLKGPNKWGYDLFTIQIEGDANNGILGLRASYNTVDKGGKNVSQMLRITGIK